MAWESVERAYKNIADGKREERGRSTLHSSRRLTTYWHSYIDLFSVFQNTVQILFYCVVKVFHDD